jgi:hypothetical protein
MCFSEGGSPQGPDTTCSTTLCPQPPAPCCYPDGSCATNVDPSACSSAGGEPGSPGGSCQGDSNGNGLDDLCEDQPCSDAGPGPHWVDTAPAGTDFMPTGALVGVDTDLDCVRDQNLVMFGPAMVRRTGSVDDSAHYPGTRPIDGHLDVLDTEMVGMKLTGGGATLIAGAGRGAMPLGA